MHKKITFRHMDHSKIMEEYANKQLAKVENFLENENSPVYIDLILEPSKVHEHHRVELRVKSPRYDLIANYEHQGMDFYQTLDHVIDVMYRQLLKQKQKAIDDRKQCGRHEDFKKQR